MVTSRVMLENGAVPLVNFSMRRSELSAICVETRRRYSERLESRLCQRVERLEVVADRVVGFKDQLDRRKEKLLLELR